MTADQATGILQQLINVGVQRGIFAGAADVIMAQQALDALQPREPAS